jgi:hypothetical protein
MKATRSSFRTLLLAVFAVGILGDPALAQMTTPYVESTNALGTNYFLGKTGIGTNAPAEKLHVVGESRLDGGLTVEGALRIPQQGDLGMGTFTNGVSDQGVAASNLALRGAWISYSGASEGLTVTPDGHVGVGTATPSTDFHVAGEGRFTDLVVDDELTLGGIGRTTWPEGGDDLGNHSATQTLDLGSHGMANVGWMTLGGETRSNWPSGGSGTAWNHLMTQNLETAGYWISGDGDDEGVQIGANGRVGIGTNSPLALLHVAGDILIPQGYSLYIKDSGPGDSGSRLRIHGTGGHGYIDCSGELHFRFGTNASTDRVVFFENGNTRMTATNYLHYSDANNCVYEYHSVSRKYIVSVSSGVAVTNYIELR